MSMSPWTRSGGNVTPLFAVTARPDALSRRNALGAVAAVALSLAALGAAPLAAQAAPVAIVLPTSPDADLIALASRIVALAHRCEAVADRRGDIEDRIFVLCPPPRPLPKPPFRDLISETPTATGRILNVIQDREPDPAWRRWEEATAATNAAHERQEQELSDQLGLPEVARRQDRMERRRDRWAGDLTAMAPSSKASLSAKVGAILVLLGKDRGAMGMELAHRVALVMSVLADVARPNAGEQA